MQNTYWVEFVDKMIKESEVVEKVTTGEIQEAIVYYTALVNKLLEYKG